MGDVSETEHGKKSDEENETVKYKALKIAFSILLEKETDFNKMMKIRQINKCAEEVALQKLYYYFRNLKIQIVENKNSEKSHLFVNGIDLIISNNSGESEFFDFIRFLCQTVKVAPWKLELINMHLLPDQFFKTVHNAIFDELFVDNNDKNIVELIGMEDICPMGCKKCTRLVSQCRVYGPVQLHAFENGFPNWKRFDTLLISERLLNEIIDKIAFPGIPPLEIWSSLEQIIPNVSCDNLILSITEKLIIKNEENVLNFNAHPTSSSFETPGIPREILNDILTKWKPSSISLKCYAPKGSRMKTNLWYIPGRIENWFSKVDFSENPEKNYRNRVMEFSSVHIDLSDSIAFSLEFEEDGTEDEDRNLVSNVRRLFPTHNLSIILPRCFTSLITFDNTNSGIVKAIWKEDAAGLNVNVQLFPIVLCPSRGFSSKLNVGPHNVDVIFENGQILTTQCILTSVGPGRKKFKNATWIGKRYVISDQSRNHEIQVNISMENNTFLSLVHMISKPWHIPDYFGFLGKFITPEHKRSCFICAKFLRQEDPVAPRIRDEDSSSDDSSSDSDSDNDEERGERNEEVPAEGNEGQEENRVDRSDSSSSDSSDSSSDSSDDVYERGGSRFFRVRRN